jgi:hypothetical protein
MNYNEISYLQRANKVNIDNIIKVDIEKKYSIKCNGIKKTSNAKKTTSHKIDIQIAKYSDVIGDISINGIFAKKVKNDLYSNKRKDARKKLK